MFVYLTMFYFLLLSLTTYPRGVCEEWKPVVFKGRLRTPGGLRGQVQGSKTGSIFFLLCRFMAIICHTITEHVSLLVIELAKSLGMGSL